MSRSSVADSALSNPDTEKSPLTDGGDFSYVFIPHDIAAKAEKELEARKRAKRKYEAKRPYRNRDRSSMSWLSFCFWDGEGPRDAGYALFGNSLGYELCKPFLSTEECLELILEVGTDNHVIHVWFGGNYDVSMILHDLGFRHFKKLKDHKVTIWKGYRIEYVPRKWLSISNGRVKVKIYDVVSFFGTNFQTAVHSFGVCTDAQYDYLSANKEKRDKFLWADIDDIKKYWRLELDLGAQLMEELRRIFDDAGFKVNSWHGPGALARVALKRNHVEKAMYRNNSNQLPKALEIERINAVRYAFAGGRFEMVHGGYIDDTIYSADLRSAYPHFARYLPNLAKGIWRYTNSYERGKFGVYHVRYSASGQRYPARIYPLFDRRKDGIVCWPDKVEGWYWNPETELVANDPDATILEGWVFDETDENDRPFAWIEEYFEKRQVLKRVGNPAEFTFKLIINSVYGQLAQRTGWDERNRKAPRYHQLEWAGYITSACRAEVYRVANNLQSRDALISIDTDGIFAREPLPVFPSANLGGWEVNTYPRGMFWQSGIYYLSDKDGGWKKGKAKSRGIPKGQYSYEQLRDCYNRSVPLKMTKHMFVGFGLALNGRFNELNTWHDEKWDFAFGGTLGGKRYHNSRYCKQDCNGDVHVFRLGLFRPEMSNLHKLPWLEVLPEAKLATDDRVMYDLNDLDDGEEWVWEYEPA